MNVTEFDEPGQRRKATQSWTVLLLQGNRLSRFTDGWCIPYCDREECPQGTQIIWVAARASPDLSFGHVDPSARRQGHFVRIEVESGLLRARIGNILRVRETGPGIAEPERLSGRSNLVRKPGRSAQGQDSVGPPDLSSTPTVSTPGSPRPGQSPAIAAPCLAAESGTPRCGR
jgi:hypothetical protein